jgi:hypothetical protein
MCLNPQNENLYVATKEDSSLYVISLKSKKMKKLTSLFSEGYAVHFDEINQLVWISEWGNQTICLYDVKSHQIRSRIKVGSNPNEFILDSKSQRAFVCCANDNSVHVISLNNFEVQEILNTSLYPNSPTGSTPNGLDLDVQNQRLFVVNADNNNMLIFNVKNIRNTQIVGFFPTGWYPTQVKFNQGQLYISNAKGLYSLSNPNGPNPIGKRKNSVEYQKGISNSRVEYIGGLFKGNLQKVDSKGVLKEVRQFTHQVKLNTPYNSEMFEFDSFIPQNNPIPNRLGKPSPIKHVFYIIKENRTFDQVLSDIPGGDGDTSLLLFGENITPNQHKLAKDFVLLDHFFVDAEVSADGHNWSTAAIANDYTEKTWPTSYGGRGGDYVYEGQSITARPLKGFIWDHAKSANIRYRTYGEFADNYQANIPALKGQFCPYFTSWDENIRDTTRFSQWKRDFDSLLLINKVPQLNTLRFINDHTEGVRKDRPTPFAHIADNDYAVGLFVEYLSKSTIWNQSVVFILEDDAQNGADHIDAHRSTAYVAGGLVKNHFIDHTTYSTSSMLRTIELILGMSPMSQYDVSAKSMWRCFQDSANGMIFHSVLPKVDLNEKNTMTNSKSHSYLMQQSEKLNLEHEDMADEHLMNDLLWKYVHGVNAKLPPIKRQLFNY